MTRWQSNVLCILISLGLALPVIVALALLSTPRPPTKSAPEPESRVVLADDTGLVIYRVSDSVYVRAVFIPHGKGVVVEIQPVKKVRVKKEAK